MAENLKNTVLIENTEYNINAVYSDTAGKVAQSLKVKSSGVDSVAFDGSQSVVIDHVSAADGGKFSSAVLIDNKYETLNNIPDQAIVNFGQISNLVQSLKASPLFKLATWENTSLPLTSFTDSDGSIQGLRVIIGTTQDFDTLKRFMGIPDLTATKSAARYYGMVLAGIGSSATYYETCSVGSYNDSGKNYAEVIIPTVGYLTTDSNNVLDLVHGSTVVKIRSEAFKGKTYIKKVVIPKSIVEIESSAFSGCSGLTNVYYEGTEEDWLKIKISSTGNSRLTDAVIEYNAPIAKMMVSPCMFISTSTTDAAVDATSKVFLKLPDNGTFVDLTQGAVRLDSAIATTSSYYTYESLAEIIARINTRLDALGIPVTESVLAPEAPLTINKVNEIIPDVEITNDLDKEIPTIEDLNTTIATVSTNLTTAVNNIKNGTTVAGKATKDGSGRTISTGYYQSSNTSYVNKITISTSDPDASSGNIGDIWIKYE